MPSGNSGAFMDWLADCVDEFGVEAIAADGLNAYKPVAERLGLKRQICMAQALSCCVLSGWFETPRTKASAARAWRLSGKRRALLCRRRRGTFLGRTT